MQPNTDGELQALIDNMLQGDPTARRRLLERACDRLRRLAARMLTDSFPALRHGHELDSIVHETWLRLVQALDKTEPPTVADFFRLAAFKIRHVLLDMADKQRKQRNREEIGLDSSMEAGRPYDGTQQTYNPVRLAMWTEFHERVQGLPDDERTVFEMHFYLEIPQTEIARVLSLHPRKVSYLWVAATEKLADDLSRITGG